MIFNTFILLIIFINMSVKKNGDLFICYQLVNSQGHSYNNTLDFVYTW